MEISFKGVILTNITCLFENEMLNYRRKTSKIRAIFSKGIYELIAEAFSLRVKGEILWPSVLKRTKLAVDTVVLLSKITVFLLEENMRRRVLVLMALFMVFSLSGCGKSNENVKKQDSNVVEDLENSEKTDIVVFAAASLTETLDKIKAIYEEENKNVSLVYTFDSSGTLKTQIEEGAKCDLFISAAQKQIDSLDPSVKTEPGKYIIDPDSRINLLENKVTLAIPNNSQKEVSYFKDLNTDKVEKIALGNSDVPVGQYSEELLKNLGIWDSIQDKVTYGSNVKEVTTWISEGVVDAGIVYKTDAYSTGLKVVFEADESLLKTPVIYPAAILDNSEVKEETEKFLEFLKGEKAREIFEEVGFKVVD